jgi:hypothetical protein
MTLYKLSLTLASIVFAANAGTAAELSVEADKENVVSSRLEGDWQLHGALTQRLTGEAKSRPGSLSFTSDPSVAGKIPDKYAKVFAERTMKIYLAGYVNFDGKNHPFVVTNVHGNPHVLFWLERDGDPFGNGESFIVMLTVAKDKQHDLLFVGGDFNNQPFSAFERVKAEPKK